MTKKQGEKISYACIKIKAKAKRASEELDRYIEYLCENEDESFLTKVLKGCQDFLSNDNQAKIAKKLERFLLKSTLQETDNVDWELVTEISDIMATLNYSQAEII